MIVMVKEKDLEEGSHGLLEENPWNYISLDSDEKPRQNTAIDLRF
jgi:hypothetical protein